MRSACQLLFYYTIVKPFVWTFTGVVVKGRRKIEGRGPFIVVANHNSHLDTVVLFHMLGGKRLPKVRPVAAADYFCRSRVVRLLTTCLFNILPIDRRTVRDCQQSVSCMSAALSQGQSLISSRPRGWPQAGSSIHRYR